MSRRNVLVAAGVSAGLVALLACVYLLEAGGGGKGDQEVRLRDLAARVNDLEEDLDGRLLRIEERLGSLAARSEGAAPERRRDPEASASPGELEGAPEPGLAGLESRLDELRLRIEAIEIDPLSRGYSFLGSESEELRREGIQVLKRLGRFDPEARAAIRQLLSDPSARVRLEALDAMKGLRDKESIPAMMALLSDPEALIRRRSIDALGELGAREAAGPICQALVSEPDAKIREKAADVLGNLKSSEGAEYLIGALRDRSEAVRGEAIASLGEIGAKGAIPSLREMYQKDPGVHHMRLVVALRALGDPEPFRQEIKLLSQRALADADETVRIHSIQDLGRFARDSAQDVFQKALQDPSSAVRREAEKALNKKKKG